MFSPRAAPSVAQANETLLAPVVGDFKSLLRGLALRQSCQADLSPNGKFDYILRYHPAPGTPMPKLSSQTVTMLDGGAGVLLPRSWMLRLPEVHLHFSMVCGPAQIMLWVRSRQRGHHGIINCISG